MSVNKEAQYFISKMAKNNKYTEILKITLQTISAFVLCISLTFFVILSIPVYLFRYLLIHRPKSWGSDLDEICDPQSAAFSNDYFTKTAPRSHAILTQYIEGHVTTEELRELVLKNWINARDPETGELIYKKFQQYPERWLGFTFWKNGEDTFSIENHVHKLHGKEKIITDAEIDSELEKLLNRHFPRNQSPWSFHVIENYKKTQSSGKSEQFSVIIFTLHHCLTDGYGLLTALVEGLYQQAPPNKKLKSSNNETINGKIQRSILDKVGLHAKSFYDLTHILAQQFSGAPWLMPDRRKKWHQFIARPEPILLQDIKAIRNKFGGSLYSIIVSAVSAATYKMLEKSSSSKNVKSMLCITSVPISGTRKKKGLSNYVTGAIFDMPTTKMLGPVKRFRKVNEILETNKESAVALHYFSVVLGSHFYSVCEPLIMNRSIPMGVTNVPVPIPFKLNGKPIFRSETMAGCLQGDVGIGIASQSYGNEVRVGVTVEAGLFSSDELKKFVKFFNQEISSLRDLAGNGN